MTEEVATARAADAGDVHQATNEIAQARVAKPLTIAGEEESRLSVLNHKQRPGLLQVAPVVPCVKSRVRGGV